MRAVMRSLVGVMPHVAIGRALALGAQAAIGRTLALGALLAIGAWLALGTSWPLGVDVAAAQEPKRLLFLTHAGLYKHASLDDAEHAVAAWGEYAGYEVTSLEGYRQTAPDLDLSLWPNFAPGRDASADAVSG